MPYVQGFKATKSTVYATSAALLRQIHYRNCKSWVIPSVLSKLSPMLEPRSLIRLLSADAIRSRHSVGEPSYTFRPEYALALLCGLAWVWYALDVAVNLSMARTTGLVIVVSLSIHKVQKGYCPKGCYLVRC